MHEVVSQVQCVHPHTVLGISHISKNTCVAVRLGNKLFVSVKPINFNATVLKAAGILAASCG